MSENEENTEPPISIWSLIIIFGGVITIWIGSYFFMHWYFESPEHSGPAGDTFGAATSLFSGLAFAGLLITLWMQKRELQLQREQLVAQTEELELQRGELSDTRKEFEIQRFENRFFGMLKLLNDHVNSFSNKRTKGSHTSLVVYEDKGREVFKYWLPIVCISDSDSDKRSSNPTLENFKENYQNGYNKELESKLGPYFSLLYNIFRQLNSQNWSNDEAEDLEIKKGYAAIVRAQLSSEEIILLMLNGISDVGQPFKGLITDYALLEHLPLRFKEKNHVLFEFYGSAAFGDRAHLFFDDIEKPKT